MPATPHTINRAARAPLGYLVPPVLSWVAPMAGAQTTAPCKVGEVWAACCCAIQSSFPGLSGRELSPISLQVQGEE